MDRARGGHDAARDLPGEHLPPVARCPRLVRASPRTPSRQRAGLLAVGQRRADVQFDHSRRRLDGRVHVVPPRARLVGAARRRVSLRRALRARLRRTPGLPAAPLVGAPPLRAGPAARLARRRGAHDTERRRPGRRGGRPGAVRDLRGLRAGGVHGRRPALPRRTRAPQRTVRPRSDRRPGRRRPASPGGRGCVPPSAGGRSPPGRTGVAGHRRARIGHRVGARRASGARAHASRARARRPRRVPPRRPGGDTHVPARDRRDGIRPGARHQRRSARRHSQPLRAPHGDRPRLLRHAGADPFRACDLARARRSRRTRHGRTPRPLRAHLVGTRPTRRAGRDHHRGLPPRGRTRRPLASAAHSRSARGALRREPPMARTPRRSRPGARSARADLRHGRAGPPLDGTGDARIDSALVPTRERVLGPSPTGASRTHAARPSAAGPGPSPRPLPRDGPSLDRRPPRPPPRRVRGAMGAGRDRAAHPGRRSSRPGRNLRGRLPLVVVRKPEREPDGRRRFRRGRSQGPSASRR